MTMITDEHKDIHIFLTASKIQLFAKSNHADCFIIHKSLTFSSITTVNILLLFQIHS